jgi:hypothetical protein
MCRSLLAILAALVCIAAILLLMSSEATAQFATIINVPPDPAPNSISSDTQLNVFDGGVIGHGFQAGAWFTSDNIEVNIHGGSVGIGFEVYTGTQMNIFNGSVGFNLKARDGSKINISGGSLGHLFHAFDGSEVMISGGIVGWGFQAYEGSKITMSGGHIGDDFRSEGSEIVISGGSVGDHFSISMGEINLLGWGFSIDGAGIPGLIVGVPCPVTNRDVTLSGHFANGSEFSFELNSVEDFVSDYFSPHASLSVTLVAAREADFNGDGDVDGDDFLAWQGGFRTTSGAAKADGDFDNDGDVDGDDFLGWQAEFGSGGGSAIEAVPEPSAAILLMMAVVVAHSCGQRTACRVPKPISA